jgi:UDP-N-acetylmuramate--alanine ligase
VLVVDDYGHHPTELAATIAAARLYGRRLVVAFQPHRYSRTRDLLADFAPALAGADALLLTDVYPAGEAPLPGVDARALLATFPAGAPVRLIGRAALAAALAETARPGDLVLCLGAGDVTAVPAELLALLGGPGDRNHRGAP